MICEAEVGIMSIPIFLNVSSRLAPLGWVFLWRRLSLLPGTDLLSARLSSKKYSSSSHNFLCHVHHASPMS